MKILGIILSLVLALNMPTEQTGDLKVTLKNYPESEGTLMIGLFDESGFLDNALIGKSIKVDGQEKVTVTFQDLAYGEYAISVLHDKNGNQRMDFNQQGMPLEDWTMSGTNPPDQQPQWELTKFTSNQSDQTIELSF